MHKKHNFFCMRIKSCPVKGIAGQPPFRERTASAGFKPVPALQAPAPFCQTAKKEACNITPKAALPPGLSQSNKRTADAASQKKGLGQRTPAEPDHEKKVCGLFRFCQRNGVAHCSRLFLRTKYAPPKASGIWGAYQAFCTVFVIRYSAAAMPSAAPAQSINTSSTRPARPSIKV